jgi:hypothetical protein
MIAQRKFHRLLTNILCFLSLNKCWSTSNYCFCHKILGGCSGLELFGRRRRLWTEVRLQYHHREHNRLHNIHRMFIEVSSTNFNEVLCF